MAAASATMRRNRHSAKPGNPVAGEARTLGALIYSANPGWMTLADIPQFDRLTAEENLQLVEDLWDSIGAEMDALPVRADEKKLLDARLEAHLSAPESALTLGEFKQRLAERL
jgi:putative addiction module component (TIGR02574 family)